MVCSEMRGYQVRLQFPHSPCCDLSKSATKINWLPLERLTVVKGNMLARSPSLALLCFSL